MKALIGSIGLVALAAPVAVAAQDTPEAAEWFLQQLMGPFEGYENATNETVH